MDKLLNDRARIVAAMRAISDAAKAEDRTDLNEAEQAKFDSLKTELDEVNAAITVEETIRQAELSLSPIHGASQPLNAAPEPEPEPQGFDSFGEMLKAVATAGRTQGAQVDPRLLAPQAASGLQESIGNDGGFLVGTDIASGLMQQTYETGILASRCNRIPISANANGLKINGVDETSRADGSQFGGVTSYWLNEAGTLTASTPKFRQVELSLKKLIGMCYATDELLADAAALESVISTAFPNVFGFKIDKAIFRGTGAGQPLGILGADATVTVSEEAAQTTTTIVAENIEKMYSRMWARGISSSAWLINQDVWPQLFQLSHTAGMAGVPVFLPPGNDLSAAPHGTLLGRPIVPCEHCSTLGTIGDIAFVDLSQYTMIDKGGVKSDSSIHVKFTTDEMTFRFVVRVDGQPTWASALTPANGSNTVSPFVILETRDGA